MKTILGNFHNVCVLWGISLLNTIATEGEHFDNRSYPLLIKTVLDRNDLFWQKKHHTNRK